MSVSCLSGSLSALCLRTDPVSIPTLVLITALRQSCSDLERMRQSSEGAACDEGVTETSPYKALIGFVCI